MKKMMPKAIMALALALSLAGSGLAAPPPLIDEPLAGGQQVTCPVQHDKVNKDLYVDYKGQRIYFCCKECIPIFNKDPEAYLKRMQQEGVTPEKTPAAK